jgi:hypothetical protein
LARSAIYRSYPGSPIALPILATDPDGSRLSYQVGPFPDGASFDVLSALFNWTPSPSQVGVFYVPVVVQDDGVPPLDDADLLRIAIAPPTQCRIVQCDPALGCETTGFVPVEENCCEMSAAVGRAAEPIGECPETRVLHVGRNLFEGFGRIQDCDRFRVINFGQVGATVRFNIETRCLNNSQPVTLQAHMRTAHRVLFDSAPVPVLLRTAENGFLRRVGVAFTVLGPGPFFEFEGAEAELFVTLTDVDGVTVSDQLRLQLTFEALDDLADIPDPTPVSTAPAVETGSLH